MAASLFLPAAALAFPDINPVIVDLGWFSPRWYGLGYVVGIVFAWIYAKRLVLNSRLWLPGQQRVEPLDIDDLVLWAAAGIVLGGRLGYVLFYNPSLYLKNPLEIIKIMDGGMSFHGGFVGATLAMVLFARARKIPVWTLFDVIAAGAPVAFGVVRIANFINAELWGRATDVSWAVVFCNDRIAAANRGFCPAGYAPRHPSQIYEALGEGLLLFLVLLVLTHVLLKLKRPGFVTGAFIAGYAVARISVEFFREPDVQIGFLLKGWLTMGMVLSVPMLVLGIWAMATARPAPTLQASS